MTQEQVEKKIEEWHGSDIQVPIHKFLGWSEEEYSSYIETGKVPDDK